MVKVIAQEHVGGRGLLGGGFERRVRLDERHLGEPTAVGNPQ